MNQNQDIAKALAYVGRDPDVDIQDFERFLLREFEARTEGKESTQRYQDSPPDELGFHVFSAGQGGRTRMQPAFMRDQATNDPYHQGEHEAFMIDSIPMSTYRQMSFDPQIILGLFLLKGWVGSLKYNIHCSDPEKKAVVKYALDGVWKSLVRNLVDSVVFGFQFGEKVWERDQVELQHPDDPQDGEYVFKGHILKYKKIKFLDPMKEFKFYKDNTDEITKVVQRKRTGEVTIPREKLVWFALDSRFSEIFGTSRLKAVYMTWYYAQITNQLLLRDNEQRGAPHLEVRFPTGDTIIDGERIPNHIVAARYAQSIKSTGVLILPSSTDDKGNKKWTAEYADNKQNSDNSPFMNYIKYADNRKMSAIGVPAAVLGDATYGQADAQSDLLLVIIEDIVSQIEEVIQKDVVRQLVEFNWGPKEVPKVKLTIDRSSLGRKKLFKEVLIHVMRIASTREGFDPKNLPSIIGLCEDLDIPVSRFEDMFNLREVPDSDELGGAAQDPLDEWIEDMDSNDVHRIQETDRSDEDRKNKEDSFRE
jgi:hypothetical protein